MRLSLSIVVSLLVGGMSLGLAYAEEVILSEKLSVIPIEDGIFVHRTGNDNGIVVLSDGEALIVSTPADDVETRTLIQWVVEEKEATLVGYVADRWHPDAMGGLRAVHRAGVRSYAHNRTRQIARERGLPVPQIGFDDRMEIEVGDKTVVLDFLGESHTRDGIVVWVPDDLVLFGGNGVRNHGGWFGNIGDANLAAWAQTIEIVKARYGAAEHVVPGHGSPGGAELLDYTISLYEPFSNTAAGAVTAEGVICSSEEGLLVEEASRDEENAGVRSLQAAVVFIGDSYKAVRIQSPDIRIDRSTNRMTSATGAIDIFDTEDGVCRQRVSLSYSNLFVVEVDEAVGLAIVLEEAGPLAPSRQ